MPPPVPPCPLPRLSSTNQHQYRPVMCPSTTTTTPATQAPIHQCNPLLHQTLPLPSTPTHTTPCPNTNSNTHRTPCPTSQLTSWLPWHTSLSRPHCQQLTFNHVPYPPTTHAPVSPSYLHSCHSCYHSFTPRNSFTNQRFAKACSQHPACCPEHHSKQPPHLSPPGA